MSMIIPPASDLEAMAKFLTENTTWSPVFDDNGVQIGVQNWIMAKIAREREHGDGA